MIKKDIVLAVLAVFCLTAALFRTIPTWSLPVYDPWLDYNDDGKIDARDVSPVSAAYGAKGTSLTKSSLAYDSGWVNITDKRGQDIVITHNLNVSDWNNMSLMVDITGRTTPSGNVQRYLGLTTARNWNKTYGDSGCWATSVVQTSDGGYALVGDNYWGSNNFFKIDGDGNLQWNKSVSAEPYFASLSDVVRTNDGGYAIAGALYGGSLPFWPDFWLVKTDASGNMIWNQTYGGPSSLEDASSVVQTSDGGYALAGSTNSSGNPDFWLVKTDASGTMQWNQTYGGPSSLEDASSVVQTSDGGYALAGSGFANLVKTDASGNMQWANSYGAEANDLVQTADGGYALAGTTYGAGNADFWLVKTDADGNMLWNQTYGGTGSEYANSMVQTEDGGYALGGTTTPGNEYAWLVKTDASGNMQWSNTLKGEGANAEGNCVIQTTDGGYVLAGSASDYNTGNFYFWIARIEQSVESGLAWMGSTENTVTLYRGSTDANWNFVHVQIWKRR